MHACGAFRHTLIGGRWQPDGQGQVAEAWKIVKARCPAFLLAVAAKQERALGRAGARYKECP
jgi:hypothetical protein